MKKILVISYYWPPSGGSGVQRWVRFVKYLPKNGWIPIVFTPKNPYFDVQDDSLLDNDLGKIQVWKYPIWEPYRLKDRLFGKSSKEQNAGVISRKDSLKDKFINWIRGNVFIPDPKIYWVRPSVAYLSKKIKEHDIKYIITTGPPHSMHLIGLKLKKLYPQLIWIADFRDPWSELDILEEFYLSRYARKKHKMLERKVLKKANLVLTVSETWAKDLCRIGAKNVKVITNGFDKNSFPSTQLKHDKFIIGHYGLLNHLRNPKYLWRSLEDLCLNNKEFNERLEIHLAGNIDPVVFEEISSYSNLKNKIKILGYLTHNEVLQEYCKASILLLLLFDSKSGVGNYPGKIFEYFAAKKPIFAFGPKKSDAQALILETNSGIYYNYEESNLSDSILRLFKDKESYSSPDLTQFDCQILTRRLSDTLDKL